MTSNFPAVRNSRLMRSRSVCGPWKGTTRSSGHQCLSSMTHEFMTERGAMTMCGPSSPRTVLRNPSSEITCSVFPRPISSPRIPPAPLSCCAMSHLSPSIWYGRISPCTMQSGCRTTGFRPFPALSVGSFAAAARSLAASGELTSPWAGGMKAANFSQCERMNDARSPSHKFDWAFISSFCSLRFSDSVGPSLPLVGAISPSGSHSLASSHA
mmetsp:Transcript_6958/g.15357  ORF Transcript_6958/g.15357 Transcript_6958/m.15357 type:complete len:212 (+) Transcript_6958:1418-2053(+)